MSHEVEVIDGEIYGLYTALEERGYAIKEGKFDEMLEHIQHKLDEVAQNHLREHLIELCGEHIEVRKIENQGCHYNGKGEKDCE